MPELDSPARALPVVCSGEELADPARLPVGCVQTSVAHRRLTLRAAVPLDLCLRWLRETTRGLLRSHLPLRFSMDAGVEVEAEAGGQIATRVWRTGCQVHVSHWACAGREEPLGASARVVRWRLPEPDPLLAALLGVHPLEWFREAVMLTGSRERSQALADCGVDSDTMDRLARRWSLLELEDEARLWDALATDAAAARDALGDSVELAAALRRRACSTLNLADPPPWTQARLREFAGPPWPQRLRSWRQLRDRLFEEAQRALAGQVAGALALAAEMPGAPLAEASFELRGPGLARYRRFLAGDLTAARSGALERVARRRRCVDIELPFRSRDEITGVAEAFPRAQIALEERGRVVLHECDARDGARQESRRASTLALAGFFAHRGERWDTAPPCVFEYERTLDPAEDPEGLHSLLPSLGITPPALPRRPVRAALSVTLAGEWFAAWAASPHPRQPDFGPAFERVSIRLQRLLRRWVPALWLNHVDRFAMLEIAYPLAVYAATPPRVAGPESGFTYDTTLCWSVMRARKGAAAALPDVLAAIEQRLQSAGQPRLAEYYHSRRLREVARSAAGKTGLYPGLLRNEAYLLDELIRLAENARGLRPLLARESSKAGRWLAQVTGETARRMHRRLAGPLEAPGLAGLGALIIMEATLALAGEPTEAQLHASLRAEWDGLLRVWTN